MNLYQITLPQLDNAGGSYAKAHVDFTNEVLGMVGGYTVVTDGAEGHWRSYTGQEYVDINVVYQVACEPRQWQAIVASAFRLFGDQVALFTAQIGTAHIFQRENAALAIA